MKVDNLLYSPSLTGYCLTKPLVRSSLFFKKKISLSTKGFQKAFWVIANNISKIVLVPFALVGMGTKWLDFHLRVKVTCPKVSEAVKEAVVTLLIQSVTAGTLSPANIYAAYKGGVDFGLDYKPNSHKPRNTGSEFIKSIFEVNIAGPKKQYDRLSEGEQKKQQDLLHKKLTQRDLSTISALVQCGANVRSKLIENVCSYGNEIELLRFLLANGGSAFPSKEKDNFLMLASKTTIEKVVLIYNSNPMLLNKDLLNRINNDFSDLEEPTKDQIQIHQFLNRMMDIYIK